MYSNDVVKEPELWAPAGPPPQEHFAPPLSRKSSQVFFLIHYSNFLQQQPLNQVQRSADIHELPRAHYQPAIIQTRVRTI